MMSQIIAWMPAVRYGYDTVQSLFEASNVKKKFTNNYPTRQETFPNLTQVREDILVVPHVSIGGLALGTNFSKDALIFYNKELFEIEPAGMSFICKHEFSHILHNDNSINPALVALTSSISALALPYFQSILPFWFAPFVPSFVGALTHIAASRFAESRADDFAISHAENEELHGFEALLLGRKLAYEEKNKGKYDFYFSFTNYAEGSDDLHPPTKARLDKMRHALKERGLPFSTDEDIQEIKKYFLSRP